MKRNKIHKDKEKSRFSALKVLIVLICVLAVLFVVIHVSHVSSTLDPIHMSSNLVSARVDNVAVKQPAEQSSDHKILSQYTDGSLSAESQTKEEKVESQAKRAKDSANKVPLEKTQTELHPVEEGHEPATKLSQNSPSFTINSPRHKILGLSDEDFSTIDVGTMMSWYGEANGGGSCPDDFGNALVKRWRAKRANYCRYDAGADDAHSSIECYHVLQTKHHGFGDNLCVMKNVGVQLGLFGDDASTRPIVKRYVDTMHGDQPYIHFSTGFVTGDCRPEPSVWHRESFPGWNEDWTTQAYQHVDNIWDTTGLRGADNSICDEWVEHPVIVAQRDTFANFFHDSEDFVNVFLAMAILQLNRKNTQLYLTDLYPKGPFWDIWSRPFSDQLPALDAWDLRKAFGNKPKGKNHRVCFKELVVNIYGPAAPITVASWDTPCSDTALVRAYADFVIRGMGLQSYTHYSQPTPKKEIVITYLARRASSEWPEKRFCDDQNSFFICSLWEKFGIRQLGRMIRNDHEVVSALKQLEHETFKSGAIVRFQDVDFNLLSLEDQIKVDLETDILIGPHGAGLMHSIFMRDRAVLMEMHIDQSGANRHFHNLAHWSGHRYVSDGRINSNPVRVSDMVGAVRDTVNSIDLNSY